MDMQSSSDSSLPKPGDLVWAKMRGFPPWPAKVLEKDKNTPFSRIPVIFFGTGEKAFMKPSEVFDYYENKAQYEVPRKHKGFNEAVHEIRVAAGFETSFDADPLFGATTSNKSPSPMSGAGKVLADVFLSGFGRRRADSASTRSRSRTSSSASALKKLHKAMHRRRMDSGSSAGSRRVKGLGGFGDRGLDFFDNFQTLDGTDFNVLDDEVNLLANDDARSHRSKRSHTSSKLYDDLLFNGTRNRSGSASDAGKRSRYLFHCEFVHSLFIPEVHSYICKSFACFQGRPGTPEAPAPLLNPAVFCTACGCECKSHDGRWSKVEKTPAIGADGHRECIFCSGQVRPQMCGSNRHRWRCVDKRCRKWYGWVKSNEEIPKYVNKKGKKKRYGNRAKKVLSTSRKEKEDDTGMKKRLGRPPKEHGLKIRLKGVKERKEVSSKHDDLYTLRFHYNTKKFEEKNFEPCGIERRVRWWLSEKRRLDSSPERSFETNVIDSCAAFRMLSQAFRAAAVTRADEAQSVSGALDMLMDSLMGSFGPLLTVASVIPGDLSQILWNSTAVHLPTFQ
uniref:PWWP domain-containing protein n=1 Tax=Angiostrongylus cantonensis TaxID=6313 RepID=A0A158PA34_ANGCA